MRKFIGEYISGMKDEQPVYENTGPHVSLESAMQAAVEKSKAAHVIEWVAVTEYVWSGHPKTGYWEKASRHVGDWEQQEAEA